MSAIAVRRISARVEVPARGMSVVAAAAVEVRRVERRAAVTAPAPVSAPRIREAALPRGLARKMILPA
jgi:hypothetical protein